MAGERRTQKSPNGGRTPGRPAAARLWGAGPGPRSSPQRQPRLGPGGQCRQPVRGSGGSSSPRQPKRTERRWRRGAEVAANCAPSWDARGMSPRRAYAHRRGPSRSLPQPPRGEGFLLAARSRALPTPASMPSAPPAAPAGSAAPGFPGAQVGGGDVGGACDLSPEKRIPERRESRSWMRSVGGLDTLKRAGKAQVGELEAAFFHGAGVPHKMAALREVCGREGPPQESGGLCCSGVPLAKARGLHSESPLVCVSGPEAFGCLSGGWSSFLRPRRSSLINRSPGKRNSAFYGQLSRTTFRGQRTREHWF